MNLIEIVWGFFMGVVFTIIATLAAKDEYKIHIESYQMGQKHALRTNPVSWELEETCMSLWMRKEHETR